MIFENPDNFHSPPLLYMFLLLTVGATNLKQYNILSLPDFEFVKKIIDLEVLEFRIIPKKSQFRGPRQGTSGQIKTSKIVFKENTESVLYFEYASTLPTALIMCESKNYEGKFIFSEGLCDVKNRIEN